MSSIIFFVIIIKHIIAIINITLEFCTIRMARFLTITVLILNILFPTGVMSSKVLAQMITAAKSLLAYIAHVCLFFCVDSQVTLQLIWPSKALTTLMCAVILKKTKQLNISKNKRIVWKRCFILDNIPAQIFLWHFINSFPKRVDAPEGEYFEFRVTGIIEWRQISKPKKNPYGFQENPKNPGPKITPKKSHTKFPSVKNFRKVFNDTTQNNNITNRMFEFVYSSYHGTTMYTYHKSNQIVLNTQKTPT